MRFLGNPSRRLVRWGFVGLALVAGGLHLFFWYAPRERAGVPVGLGARILGAERFPLGVWIAYPHQNVGKLAADVPDFDEWLAAAARLGGASMDAAPTFGPFRMPPACGLAVAVDPDRRSFLAGADVYPLVAVLSRLAGKIASNPWLAGGDVEIQGRRASVRWEGLGGWWLAAEGEELPPSLAAQAQQPPAALAWIRTNQAEGVLPAGVLRVSRRQGRLEVLSAESGDQPDAVLPSPRPVLVFLASGNLLAAGHGGVMLWRHAGGLPTLAILNGREGRWRLPAASLMSLAGDGPATAMAGLLQVFAYDRRTAERAALAAPGLGFRAFAAGTRALDAWIDPGPAASEVRRVRDVLEAVPLVPVREVQRWRDLETVLRPLTGQGPISLRIDHDPASFRLRFEPRDGSATQQPH